MPKSKFNFLLILFAILSFINLFAEYTNHVLLIFISKPLLLTMLSLYFYLNTKRNKTKFKRYILLALIFSIIGDTLLMFVENPPAKEEFFLFGLGSFLLTHIFYMLAFINFPNAKKGLIQQNKYMLIFFFIFLIGNIAFLWSGLNKDLKIPVIIYSTAIVAMIASCLNLKGILAKNIFEIILLGAILFLISDSLIGINKFKSDQIHLWQARLLIMLTYLLGQLLITIGTVRAVQHIDQANVLK